MIAAMEYQTGAPNTLTGMSAMNAIPERLGEFITRRIEDHKKMIRTLEWFGAHLGLDKPDDDLLVQRVIYEGLNALMIQKRDGKL